jgi:hypothetical protein
MARGKDAEGNLVAYEQLLLARAHRGRKAAAEGLARIAAAGRKAAASLQSAAEGLRHVQQECAKAGARFEESSRFRAECEAAAQLSSVEDMIRRRDELLAQYRNRRKRSRR